MAITVTFDTLVLNDTADLADVLVLDRMATYSRQEAALARTQRVAGGGLRVIRQEGSQRVWNVTANRVPKEDSDWLEAHLGSTLVVRDDQGRKFYALLDSVTVDEVPKPRTGQVKFSLTEVAWTEEV